MSSTFDLACALIARASITPQDAGCMSILTQRLTACGFICERMDADNVTNLWARRGTAAPLLCFAGHTDVVPPGPLDSWTSPPFVPSVRENKLYGRGAADMKSSIAAMITAIENFVRINPQHIGSIALLLTSDEEGDAINGTAHVVKTLAQRGERLDYCIVGEPTCVTHFGDTCKIGRRGSLSATLLVRGVQGHVAYPERIKNAAHLILPALNDLITTQWDHGDENFPPTSLQISNINAGTGAGNVAPGEIKVTFNLRFSPASPADQLKARIEALLQRHALDFELHWTLGAQPFLTHGEALVTALGNAVHKVCARRPIASTTGGTSDGRFIIDICPQIVEFGPLNDSIHKINEHIEITDLERLAAVYAEVMTQLLV